MCDSPVQRSGGSRWLLVLFLATLLSTPVSFAQSDLFRLLSDEVITDEFPGVSQKATLGTHSLKRVALDQNAMMSMKAGEEVRISVPGGEEYTVVFDAIKTVYGGTMVWTGYVREDDEKHRVVISMREGKVDGIIHTPNGNYVLTGANEQAYLVPEEAIDVKAPFSNHHNDIVPASSGVLMKKESKNFLLDPASPSNVVQINVMVLFDSAFKTPMWYELYSDPIAEINRIIEWTNLVFQESRIYVKLKLVHAQEYEFNDGKGGFPASDDPVIVALRKQHNASLVSYFQKALNTEYNGWCGLAQMPETFDDPNYGFLTWINARCGNLERSFAHETGHNFGSAHDAVSDGNCATGWGVEKDNQSYNRGYCNAARHPTIMAYLTPECPVVGGNIKPLFSNPALEPSKCGGAPCGVDKETYFNPRGTPSTCLLKGADNATAFNTNAPYIAAWGVPHVQNHTARVQVFATLSEAGTVTPSGNVIVPHGSTFTVTLNPGVGYTARWVPAGGGEKFCGGGITHNIYTSDPVTEACVVNITFDYSPPLPSFVTITPIAGPNGAIFPNTPVTLPASTDITFTMTPALGYAIDTVERTCSSNGGAYPPGVLVDNRYTLQAPVSDCTVSVSFKKQSTLVRVETVNHRANISLGFSGLVRGISYSGAVPSVLEAGQWMPIFINVLLQNGDVFDVSASTCPIDTVEDLLVFPSGERLTAIKTQPIAADCTLRIVFN